MFYARIFKCVSDVSHLMFIFQTESSTNDTALSFSRYECISILWDVHLFCLINMFWHRHYQNMNFPCHSHLHFDKIRQLTDRATATKLCIHYYTARDFVLQSAIVFAISTVIWICVHFTLKQFVHVISLDIYIKIYSQLHVFGPIPANWRYSMWYLWNFFLQFLVCYVFLVHRYPKYEVSITKQYFFWRKIFLSILRKMGENCK